jgi:hypothetical protein
MGGALAIQLRSSLRAEFPPFYRVGRKNAHVAQRLKPTQYGAAGELLSKQKPTNNERERKESADDEMETNVGWIGGVDSARM